MVKPQRQPCICRIPAITDNHAQLARFDSVWRRPCTSRRTIRRHCIRPPAVRDSLITKGSQQLHLFPDDALIGSHSGTTLRGCIWEHDRVWLRRKIPPGRPRTGRPSPDRSRCRFAVYSSPSNTVTWNACCKYFSTKSRIIGPRYLSPGPGRSIHV